MNLFHTRPGPLPEADLRLGQALADIATIGILQERAIRHGEVVTEQLQNALNSRVVIEQAKGVLAQLGNVAWTSRSSVCAASPAATTAAGRGRPPGRHRPQLRPPDSGRRSDVTSPSTARRTAGERQCPSIECG